MPVKQQNQGYREVQHTADWSLEVWGPDFPALLEQAALGMYGLMGARGGKSTTTVRELSFTVMGDDSESQMVAFLSEVLYLLAEERLVLQRFRFSLAGRAVNVQAEAVWPAGDFREIKAVTYHNLAIRQDEGQWMTTIVFDV